MSIETERDRLEMLKALGETVILDGREVYAVYESIPEILDFDRTVGTADLTLTVRTSDLKRSRKGSAVIIRSKIYEIVRVLPDDDGMTTLEVSLP